ncbi:LysR family transcriptional regulator [Orbaceae bacterium ESL0727]|nr:LysR family transcriptional regulator [Orbaceae bacterium ESL0727]
MDLKDLTIFKTIYETTTLNQASKILGCTQSNITARLKKLEYEFKTTFFIRSYNGVKITEDGVKFYKFALETLNKINTLKQGFINQKRKVLTSELLLRFVVIDNPNYSLTTTDIENKKTGEIENELIHNYYDQVITFNSLNSFDYQLSRTEELAICLLQTSFANNRNLPILINRDKACPLRKLSIEQTSNDKKMVEIDSLENILHLVKIGKGIAFLPQSLTEQGYKAVDKTVYSIQYYQYDHK